MSKDSLNSVRILALETKVKDLQAQVTVLETSLLNQIETSKSHLEGLQEIFKHFRKHKWIAPLPEETRPNGSS